MRLREIRGQLPWPRGFKRGYQAGPCQELPELPFHLYTTNAQDGKEVVAAYGGLNKAERNYTVTEREALAVVCPDDVSKFSQTTISTLSTS